MRQINQDICTATQVVIAHGCNSRGVMGSGVAKALRNKWPEIFPAYQHLCVEGKVKLGDVVPVITFDGKHLIGNCITQLQYGKDGGRYANELAIYHSLFNLVSLAWKIGINADEVALPKIGSGLGGLNWEKEVLPMLRELEYVTGVELVIYDYK